MKGHPAVGIAFVVAGICSVQGGAALAKIMFDLVEPTGMVWLRLLIASVILIAFARPAVRSWSRRTWRQVVLFGLVIGAMNIFYYLSLRTVSLAVAVTCELLGPLVLAFVLSRRRLDMFWVLVAGAGIAVIGARSFTGGIDLLGVCFALAAGVCWGFYILCSRSVGELVPGIGGLAVAMAVGSLVALPFGVVPAVTAVVDAPWILLPAAGVALLSSALAYGFELAALRRVPARAFGVFMALEPAVAALFGFLIARELVEGVEWIAIALVVAASAGVAITAVRRGPATDTAAIHLD